MKRRIACLLICVCLLLCMALPASAQDEGAAFTDRGRIRNVGAVQMLVDLGLISGYDDGTFRPGNFITLLWAGGWSFRGLTYFTPSATPRCPRVP